MDSEFIFDLFYAFIFFLCYQIAFFILKNFEKYGVMGRMERCVFSVVLALMYSYTFLCVYLSLFGTNLAR